MSETFVFETRNQFREWLQKNCTLHDGIWIELSKDKGTKSMKAREALEEALCFGWIDGQMQRIDDKSYKKYFSQRRKKSRWSELNKTIVEALEIDGKITDYGRQKITEAKANGMWYMPGREPVKEEEIAVLIERLEGNEPAFTNFMAMSDSVKRTYTGLFLGTKSVETRNRRLEKIIRRLNENLKPM